MWNFFALAWENFTTQTVLFRISLLSSCLSWKSSGKGSQHYLVSRGHNFGIFGNALHSSSRNCPNLPLKIKFKLPGMKDQWQRDPTSLLQDAYFTSILAHRARVSLKCRKTSIPTIPSPENDKWWWVMWWKVCECWVDLVQSYSGHG